MRQTQRSPEGPRRLHRIVRAPHLPKFKTQQRDCSTERSQPVRAESRWLCSAQSLGNTGFGAYCVFPSSRFLIERCKTTLGRSSFSLTMLRCLYHVIGRAGQQWVLEVYGQGTSKFGVQWGPASRIADGIFSLKPDMAAGFPLGTNGGPTFMTWASPEGPSSYYHHLEC